MRNRSFFPLLAIAAASLLMQACATSEKPQTARPKPATAGPAHVSDMDSALAEAARGYSPVVKDGERLFCRQERQTGSKLSSTICITEAQLRQRAEDAKKFGEGMRQQGRRCSQGPACQQ